MTRAGRKQKGRKANVTTQASTAINVPDVYTDMLAVAVSTPAQVNEEGKIIKRRRIAGRVVSQDQPEGEDNKLHQLPIATAHDGLDLENRPVIQQTIYNESEDSADSDMDWEEVGFGRTSDREDLPESDVTRTDELKLVLGNKDQEAARSMPTKRKPITSAERQLRLHIHKMHLISLIFHVYLRNHWCNDEEVHEAFKSLLSNRTLSYLNSNKDHSQFQRSRSFKDGLNQACQTFKERFKINARGISRPHWTNNHEELPANIPEDLELPMQKYDFRTAAANLEASRDIGAQLFCALLRSTGVDARLVCSLQPLPFTATIKGNTPQKAIPSMVMADPESQNNSNGDENSLNMAETETALSKQIGASGGRNRFSSDFHQTRVPESRPKRIRESPYPVFWVEAFDEAYQKWIPINALNAETRPSRFEPPSSDVRNSLTYVLAFESDGCARDVTRRYAKAYNAKTLKMRVEVTKGGENWWRKTLRLYRRTYSRPRDEIEDSELASKELAEPMPRNVLDFKNHPYYALERHLRRGEVIHPKREAGKVAVGRAGGNQILEPIFRRRDVHEVKSARSWYRMGREIKAGEQPLKRVPARREREFIPENDDGADDNNEEHIGTPLYAAHQTTLYIPPPVTNGRIPKNFYGNVDIYVPSMVPAGGTHMKHPETARAAQTLGIDHAKAVTGFAFKGRHGTAVISGAVVAIEYREAVQEVIAAFEYEKQREDEEIRSLEALRMWKRFLAGLRIRERISGYEVEGERDVLDSGMGNQNDEVREVDHEEGGGFFPDGMVASGAESPSMFQRVNTGIGPDSDGGGGFLDEDRVKNEESSFAQANMGAPGRFADIQIPDDDSEYAGGGFMTEGVCDEGSDQSLDLVESVTGRNIPEGNGSSGGILPSNINEDVEENPFLSRAKESKGRPATSMEEEIALDSQGFRRHGENSIASTGLDPDERDNEVIPQAANDVQGNVHALTSLAHLNLPESELSEATMLQRLYVTQKAPSPAPLKLTITAPTEAVQSPEPASTAPQLPAENPTISTLPPPQPPDQQRSCPQPGGGEDARKGSDSDEDAGSLLSHDPSDEDADPEWLA